MNKLFLLLILFVVVQGSFAQHIPIKGGNSYHDEIIKQRQAKDTEMRSDDNSPIPAETRKEFKGLNYFMPDSVYMVIASFERFDNPFHFKMKTTTDRMPEYTIYGKATFQLKGQEYKLNVYQNVELLKKPGYENYLFIPFNDSTNGYETYGGGRFIDGENTAGDKLIIDFNTAYNPYCAYNHKYSCPIPPEENMIPLKVEAGEKIWHE